MECARQGCDKEAIAGSNYCKAHFDLDKANVDKEEEDDVPALRYAFSPFASRLNPNLHPQPWHW